MIQIIIKESLIVFQKFIKVKESKLFIKDLFHYLLDLLHGISLFLCHMKVTKLIFYQKYTKKDIEFIKSQNEEYLFIIN